MKIQVSHGAPRSSEDDDVEWFVVRPLPGEVSGNGITNEMAVQSLMTAGRSVYEIDVEPWGNRDSDPYQFVRREK